MVGSRGGLGVASSGSSLSITHNTLTCEHKLSARWSSLFLPVSFADHLVSFQLKSSRLKPSIVARLALQLNWTFNRAARHFDWHETEAPVGDTCERKWHNATLQVKVATDLQVECVQWAE